MRWLCANARSLFQLRNIWKCPHRSDRLIWIELHSWRNELLDGLSNIAGNVFGIGMIIVMFSLSIMVFKTMIINIIEKFKPASKLTKCESCRNTISKDAFACPHCGQHYGRSRAYNSILFCFVAGSGLLFAALYGLELFLEESGYELIRRYFN